MSLPNRKTLLSGLLALTSLGAWAQKGNLDLRVIDQETGFAVRNARVELLNPTGKKENLAARTNGKLALQNREGELKFLISAPGYAPITTHFKAGAVEQLNVEVQLDRLQPLAAPALQSQRSALAPNQTQIAGYVSDREQGTPLAGVQVSVGAATAVSDQNGYYELVLTSNEAQSGPQKEEFVKQVADVTFARKGYTSYQIKRFRMIGQDYTFKNSLAPLAKRNGAQLSGKAAPMETENSVHGFYDKTGAEPEDEPELLQEPKAAVSAKNQAASAAAAVAVPSSIRVGTSCSCNSCSSVSVMSLETYVRSGIDDEWPPYFGANSLRAGTVAYRTYGAYYVVNRASGSTFDLSSTTCRQVWTSATNATAAAAADFTAGQVLVKNGAISRPEYSSENNNAGCGDGFAGTNTTGAPCISDPLCKGRAKFGHGRGMCQFGSKFWGESGKTYTWILEHYYKPINVLLQGGATPPPPVVEDTTPPTTSVTGPALAGTNFTATFADADNVGVTGRFYQPLEWRNNEWRANRGNGFYNDNFGAGALFSDYVPGLSDWAGAWAVTADGRLKQSDAAATNTGLSTFLSQTAGNTFLYNFAAKVNSTTGTRRFGLHVMASDNALRERGNSYLVWFALDEQKVSIIETVDNVLTPRASAALALSSGTFSDYKVLYNTGTGLLSVYVNNRPVASWTDPTPLTSGAHISLRTAQAEVEFDDLKVFRDRGTSATITVGAANSNDVRATAAPGAKIKSLVKDAADNWSALGNLDVDIALEPTTNPSITGPAPAAFRAQVFPNPVPDAATHVNYFLDQPQRVTMTVTDLWGKPLLQLRDSAVQAAGHHELTLGTQKLQPGVYLLRIEGADGRVEVTRILKQ
jgi:hypothetical protein